MKVTTEIDRATQATRGALPENFRIAAGQILAEATFRHLSETLTGRGIDHLVLKGPHLGALAYDEAWERPYCDLDVLVGHDQFEDALAALVEHGFTLRPEPEGRTATMEGYYNRALASPGGWLVELHRSLSGYGFFAVDYDGLFARAVAFRFGQTEARGLSVEDLMLHLVIHAAKGHFRNIDAKHVADIGHLVARQPVDWEIVLTRAREARCRTASWVMLSAARRIHRAAVPEEVLARLRPSLVRRWWLGWWLSGERFPLFRHRWLPWWLGRVLIGPALADRLRDGATAGLRYLGVRLRDTLGARREGRP